VNGADRAAGVLLVATVLALPAATAETPRPDYRAYHADRQRKEAALALETGSLERAEAHLAQALELAPRDPRGWLLAAGLAKLQGRTETRTQALDRFRQHARGNADLWWALIDEQLRSGEYDAAQEDCSSFADSQGWAEPLCRACVKIARGEEASEERKTARARGLPQVLDAAFVLHCGAL
jgi:uncharacterized protein HemY